MKGTKKSLPHFWKGITVGEESSFFIYPDGRSGPEIEVKFTATEEMISGSERDMILIEVNDNKVIVTGTSIEGIESVFSR